MEIAPQLIQLVKDIRQCNPQALLTGSLALHLQGVKLRRYPGDIDIYLPAGCKFMPLTNMVVSDGYGDNGEYDDDWWERKGYRVIGDREIKVDIVAPAEHNDSFIFFDPAYDYKNSIKMVDKFDIMKFKLQHSMATKSSKWKHQQDLIFMLIQNC